MEVVKHWAPCHISWATNGQFRIIFMDISNGVFTFIASEGYWLGFGILTLYLILHNQTTGLA